MRARRFLQARRFLAGASGQITLSLALVALPLCLTIGSAIDYGMLVTTRSALQDALDSATLAAAAREGVLDQEAARSYFTQNTSLAKVTVNTVAFSKNQDGTVTGTLAATVPAAFMRIVRAGDYTVRTTSVARGVFPPMLSKATFATLGAQGAYDKDIYLFTKDKAGRVLSETLVLRYDYSMPVCCKGTASYIPAKNVTTSIMVGPNDRYGTKMVIYVDNTLRGNKTNPVTYWSDDSLTSKWVRITGKCSDPAGEQQNWEDGGDYGFTDFVANFKCTMVPSSSPRVKLVN
jgi:Flp pilus assembly protein TadG